jgi:hypothetical protein
MSTTPNKDKAIIEADKALMKAMNPPSATASLVAALAALDNVKANKIVKANFTAKRCSTP